MLVCGCWGRKFERIISIAYASKSFLVFVFLPRLEIKRPQSKTKILSKLIRRRQSSKLFQNWFSGRKIFWKSLDGYRSESRLNCFRNDFVSAKFENNSQFIIRPQSPKIKSGDCPAGACRGQNYPKKLQTVIGLRDFKRGLVDFAPAKFENNYQWTVRPYG